MRHCLSRPTLGVGFLLSFVLTVSVGCGNPEFPTTYPVKGKVLLTGDKPLTSGAIEFECVAQPEFRGFSRIGADGTFGPVMVYKSYGRETAGLTAGEYRVRVIPQKDDEARGGDPFPKRYQDFTESGLTVPIATSDNDITIRLDSTKTGAAKKDN